MKRLQSGVKAASEKQQTNTHHRENEGERWSSVCVCVCGGGGWSQTVKGTWHRTTWSQHGKKTQLHTRRAHLKRHHQNMQTLTGLLLLFENKYGALMRIGPYQRELKSFRTSQQNNRVTQCLALASPGSWRFYSSPQLQSMACAPGPILSNAAPCLPKQTSHWEVRPQQIKTIIFHQTLSDSF